MARAEKPQSEFRPDEIDPELISLKRRRGDVGPVLAGSLVLLCAYLLFAMRADLGFAVAGSSPRKVAVGSIPDNAYVEVTGPLDLQSPGWLRGKQAIGHRLAPVHGSSGKLWVRVIDDSRAEKPQYSETWTGRTRRIADLAFEEELAAYLAGLPPQPRFVDPAALAAGTPTADVFGDALALAPDTDVELDERVGGVALVTVYLTEQVKDEAAARAALTAATLTPAPGTARATDKSWTFEVLAPDGLPAVRAQISRAGLYAAMASDSVEDKLIRHTGKWKDVSVDTGAKTVRLADGVTMPVERVARLVAFVQPSLPGDAEIVLTGDVPGDYWYTLPLGALLAIVGGLMAWAFVRSLKSDAPTPMPETPPTLTSAPPAE